MATRSTALRFGVDTKKAKALEERLERLGVKEADLVERFVRASGPGGQKINKTSVAVHLKHEPSGFEVKAAAARSQALNRYKARCLLAERLEAKIDGRRSAERQRIEKVKRQKRKRSKRAKNKMLREKKKVAEKKQSRKSVSRDD
jgi:protein subunit release factor B